MKSNQFLPRSIGSTTATTRQLIFLLHIQCSILDHSTGKQSEMVSILYTLWAKSNIFYKSHFRNTSVLLLRHWLVILCPHGFNQYHSPQAVRSRPLYFHLASFLFHSLSLSLHFFMTIQEHVELLCFLVLL